MNEDLKQFGAFSSDVMLLFQRVMEDCRVGGARRNLSVTEICTAIAQNALHCAALAVATADLPIEQFDGQLEEIARRIRLEHAEALAQVQLGRPRQLQ